MMEKANLTVVSGVDQFESEVHHDRYVGVAEPDHLAGC
jgi:hypothetical protein